MDISREIIGGDAYAMAIRQIKLERRVPEHNAGESSLQASNWTQRREACLKAGSQPAGQSKRYLNSASMSVLCRRIMAIEWMRALGRTIPANYTIVPRREPELLRTRGY